VAVGVAHVDRAERAAVEHVGALDALAAEVVAPGLLLVGAVHREREVMRRPDAHDTLGQLRVLHEGHERAGGGVDVPEPHVATLGVVVAGAVVHHREPQEVAVERDRAVEVAADRRDVVQTSQLHALLSAHGPAA
jgi:hypothetical protein